MARVAREMVERAGVKVDELLELLVKNSSVELTTYYYYTILRVNLIRDGTFPRPLLMSVYCMR